MLLKLGLAQSAGVTRPLQIDQLLTDGRGIFRGRVAFNRNAASESRKSQRKGQNRNQGLFLHGWIGPLFAKPEPGARDPETGSPSSSTKVAILFCCNRPAVTRRRLTARAKLKTESQGGTEPWMRGRQSLARHGRIVPKEHASGGWSPRNTASGTNKVTPSARLRFRSATSQL